MLGMAIRKWCVRFTDCIVENLVPLPRAGQSDRRYCKRAGVRSQSFPPAGACRTPRGTQTSSDLRYLGGVVPARFALLRSRRAPRRADAEPARVLRVRVRPRNPRWSAAPGRPPRRVHLAQRARTAAGARTARRRAHRFCTAARARKSPRWRRGSRPTRYSPITTTSRRRSTAIGGERGARNAGESCSSPAKTR